MLWAATKPTNQPTLFPKHPFSPYKGILLAANNLPILGTTKWPKCWQWCHPPARESLAFVPVPWPCFAKTTRPPSSPARNVQKRPRKILLQHTFLKFVLFLPSKTLFEGQMRANDLLLCVNGQEVIFQKICSWVLEFPCDRPQRASFRASPTASRREDMIFLGINGHDNGPTATLQY